MKFFLFNLIVTIIIEFLILVAYHRGDWKNCLHFAILVNAITIIGGTLALKYFPIDYYVAEIIIALFEAVAIYFYWVISIPRALALSYLMNLASASVFPLMQHWGMLEWLK